MIFIFRHHSNIYVRDIAKIYKKLVLKVFSISNIKVFNLAQIARDAIAHNTALKYSFEI